MPVTSQFPNGDRVLLADVDENDALQLASFLELNGYTVRRSIDKAEALVYFANFAPGIVIVDSNLPAKSWLSLIQDIRAYEVEKDSDYRSIIIVTAGRYTAELLQKANKAGAHEVVGKPINESELLKTLAEHSALY
ncbi:MAG: response regulator transcription factor [Spirochaetes bacterium]|nr:response regulator transcription factor [Spirochaetota bacterium]